MNNSKVRIYELSRELNLENKDILSICEGLNIAVKSHSSTITESDVERIRAAAEKYTERSAAYRNRDSATSAEGGSGAPSPKTIGRPNGQRKQQILEIRQYKSRPGSSSQQETPQLATPPQPPVKPPMITSPRQQANNINRPMRVSQPPERQPDPEAEPEPKDPQENAASVQVTQKPKLSEPPVRPRSKPQSTQVDRPVLKRDRPEEPISESKGTQAPAKPASPTQQPTSTAERK